MKQLNVLALCTSLLAMNAFSTSVGQARGIPAPIIPLAERDWDASRDFHFPGNTMGGSSPPCCGLQLTDTTGSPIVDPDDPNDGTNSPWIYGARIKTNTADFWDGVWENMAPSEFEPFVNDPGNILHQAYQTGPNVLPGPNGGADSGNDRNAWGIHGSNNADLVRGYVLFQEGLSQDRGNSILEVAGPVEYLKSTIHLISDDAGSNGVVDLRWVAPDDGRYDVEIRLQHRLENIAGEGRDPDYHILVNDQLLTEGRLTEFAGDFPEVDAPPGSFAVIDLTGPNALHLSAGDTLDVASTSTGFPQSIMATDVFIQQDSTPPVCDFNGDLNCDISDVDLLTGTGNLVTGVDYTDPNYDVKYDLANDLTLNIVDLLQFLSIAAIENSKPSGAYEPGDNDFDFDVDTGDLTTAIINFTGAAGATDKVWSDGDGDGDGDVDTGDLTVAIINFSGAGKPAIRAVPEPGGWMLSILACMVYLAAVRTTKSGPF